MGFHGAKRTAGGRAGEGSPGQKEVLEFRPCPHPHKKSQEGVCHVTSSSPVQCGGCIKYSSLAPVTALVTVVVKVTDWSSTGRD